jgi:hypothetical protein
MDLGRYQVSDKTASVPAPPRPILRCPRSPEKLQLLAPLPVPRTRMIVSVSVPPIPEAGNRVGKKFPDLLGRRFGAVHHFDDPSTISQRFDRGVMRKRRFGAGRLCPPKRNRSHGPPCGAVDGNGRRCCTWPTTAGSCERDVGFEPVSAKTQPVSRLGERPGPCVLTLGKVGTSQSTRNSQGETFVAGSAVTLFLIRQDRSSCVLVRCHQTRRNLQPFRQGLILCPLQSSVGRPFST